MWRSYLTATALQAQHCLVSTLLNSANSFSTLLDFNTSAFNTSCIQHYSNSTSTYLTHLASTTPCIKKFHINTTWFQRSWIQHYLILTIKDSTFLVFNKPGFNNPCFRHPWFQQSLFSTILDFNNLTGLGGQLQLFHNEKKIYI